LLRRPDALLAAWAVLGQSPGGCHRSATSENLQTALFSRHLQGLRGGGSAGRATSEKPRAGSAVWLSPRRLPNLTMQRILIMLIALMMYLCPFVVAQHRLLVQRFALLVPRSRASLRRGACRARYACRALGRILDRPASPWSVLQYLEILEGQ